MPTLCSLPYAHPLVLFGPLVSPPTFLSYKDIHTTSPHLLLPPGEAFEDSSLGKCSAKSITEIEKLVRHRAIGTILRADAAFCVKFLSMENYIKVRNWITGFLKVFRGGVVVMVAPDDWYVRLI